MATKIHDYGIRHLVLFPDSGELLFELLDEETKGKINTLRTRSMHDAVVRAAQHTAP